MINKNILQKKHEEKIGWSIWATLWVFAVTDAVIYGKGKPF